MSGWARGRAEILGMVERGDLSQVTASDDLASRLLATAGQHLASARLLAESDPYLAYAAVHDAIRKALSALLQAQGLRATGGGLWQARISSPAAARGTPARSGLGRRHLPRKRR